MAEAVTLSRSGLTRLVDRLENAGLLRREACPTDRRGAFGRVLRGLASPTPQVKVAAKQNEWDGTDVSADLSSEALAKAEAVPP
jgi:hypothetical protein